MIRITCTHCRQLLTIDDGFAGGVCRCQYCGTIQTVPAAPGKTQGRGATPAAKTLYRAEARKTEEHSSEPHVPSGSSLDELAEIVSSSGLAHSARAGKKPGGNGMARSAEAPRKSKSGKLIAAAVIIILIAAAIAAWVFWKPVNPSTGQAHNLPIAPAPPTISLATPNGPSFCGVSIQAQDTVVYLLDNGGSASDTLPAMTAACIQSIKSLGSERRFKVAFWRDDGPVYPKDGSARATPDEIAHCQTALQDVFAQGNTEADGALKLAVAARPDAIVLVTAKAGQLSDDFATSILAILGDSRTKIYTVGINGDSTTDPAKPGVLKTVADKTGGQFLNISSADLAKFAQ